MKGMSLPLVKHTITQAAHGCKEKKEVSSWIKMMPGAWTETDLSSGLLS
jgi:hypothetical protein